MTNEEIQLMMDMDELKEHVRTIPHLVLIERYVSLTYRYLQIKHLYDELLKVVMEAKLKEANPPIIINSPEPKPISEVPK